MAGRDQRPRLGWRALGPRVRLLALGMGTLAVALFVWGFVIEPGRRVTAFHEIAAPDWPLSCDGLRVAVLADLHVGSPWNGAGTLSGIVSRTESARPDIILLAGDFVIHGVVGGRFVTPERIASELGRLDAPLGVWAVLGNHDWWLDGPRIRRALESAGIGVLENRSMAIESGDCRFWLAGIGDFWEGRSDVGASLADVTDRAPVVAFTHNPDVFPDVPGRVSLTVAGHTHGGQVYIPLIGRPIVPSRYGQRYAIGHVVEDGRHLFVSPGVGTSIIPVRFLVPPEVTLIRVRTAPS